MKREIPSVLGFDLRGLDRDAAMHILRDMRACLEEFATACVALSEAGKRGLVQFRTALERDLEAMYEDAEDSGPCMNAGVSRRK